MTHLGNVRRVLSIDILTLVHCTVVFVNVYVYHLAVPNCIFLLELNVSKELLLGKYFTLVAPIGDFIMILTLSLLYIILLALLGKTQLLLLLSPRDSMTMAQ